MVQIKRHNLTKTRSWMVLDISDGYLKSNIQLVKINWVSVYFYYKSYRVHEPPFQVRCHRPGGSWRPAGRCATSRECSGDRHSRWYLKLNFGFNCFHRFVLTLYVTFKSIKELLFQLVLHFLWKLLLLTYLIRCTVNK